MEGGGGVASVSHFGGNKTLKMKQLPLWAGQSLGKVSKSEDSSKHLQAHRSVHPHIIRPSPLMRERGEEEGKTMMVMVIMMMMMIMETTTTTTTMMIMMMMMMRKREGERDR